MSTVCLDSRALVVTKDDLYYDEDGPVWKGMMAQVESMPSDQHTKNKVIREFKNMNIRMMDDEKAKKEALTTVAIFPVIMLITYLFLIFYYKSRGGYKVVDL